VPLLTQYPLLRAVSLEQWNFVITIAGVFIAVLRLRSLHIGDNRQIAVMNVVERSLERWYPNNGIRGFEDCKNMFEQNFDMLEKLGHEPPFIAHDSLGWWIVWNILGRSPGTDDERSLARVVGGSAVHEFFSWWSSEKSHEGHGGA
jgi:hypothetical protein